jgi:hypothetical protein
LDDLIARTQVLAEALPNIKRFRGKTFVVKYGHAMLTPELRSAFGWDIVLLDSVGHLLRNTAIYRPGNFVTDAPAMASAAVDWAVLELLRHEHESGANWQLRQMRRLPTDPSLGYKIENGSQRQPRRNGISAPSAQMAGTKPAGGNG